MDEWMKDKEGNKGNIFLQPFEAQKERGSGQGKQLGAGISYGGRTNVSGSESSQVMLARPSD